MGYFPAELCVLLNIVILVGYGIINVILVDQTLSAVSGGKMTIEVGIIVAAVISWVVSTFGMKAFHSFEKVSFRSYQCFDDTSADNYRRMTRIPQLLSIFTFIGCAGSSFDTSYASAGNVTTLRANRLTWFSLTFSAPIAWSTIAADYFVYSPEKTSLKAALATYVGACCLPLLHFWLVLG
jgi:purine-cytosine permease-like protein